MHYEINVSRFGQHFFATAPRSLDTLEDACRMFELFKDKFPLGDGFALRLTSWEQHGTELRAHYNPAPLTTPSWHGLGRVEAAGSLKDGVVTPYVPQVPDYSFLDPKDS